MVNIEINRHDTALDVARKLIEAKTTVVPSGIVAQALEKSAEYPVLDRDKLREIAEYLLVYCGVYGRR